VLLAQSLVAIRQRVNMQSQEFFLACFLRYFRKVVNLLLVLLHLHRLHRCCKLPTDLLLGLQRLPRRQP
jgi:hypothetical protein